MPGGTGPEATGRTAAGKRHGRKGTGRAAASSSPPDLAVASQDMAGQEAAPGWATPDWMLPEVAADEVAVLGDAAAQGGMEDAAGEWPGGEDAARGNAAPKEWFGGEEAARAACLKLLTSAPRTRAQLAAALRRRRVPDEIAESVLARFTEVGLIDDRAFARSWVESRHHSRGLARKALAAELRQRGVSDGEVRAAVASLGPQDEMAAARRLVMKRLAASRGRPLPARARQLLGMLARKGYSAGLAAKVVREALEQEEPDDPDARQDLALIDEDSASSDWL